MKTERIFWLLAVVGIGVGSVWWTNYRQSALLAELEAKLSRMLTTEGGARPAAAGHCVVSVDSRDVRESIRSAVAEACNGANTAAFAAQANAPSELEEGAAQDKIEPSPEMLQSYDAANALVERALSVRTWTAEDVVQMRPLMAELDDDSREELMLRMVRSFNEGKLEFTGRPGEMF